MCTKVHSPFRRVYSGFSISVFDSSFSETFRDRQLEETRDFCLKRKQKVLLVEAVRDMDSEKIRICGSLTCIFSILMDMMCFRPEKGC